MLFFFKKEKAFGGICPVHGMSVKDTLGTNKEKPFFQYRVNE